MPTHLVLTVMAADRPGLVSQLSDAITAGGGNWLDARMASLAGQFAGILQVAVAEAQADALAAALQALPGLRLVVHKSTASGPAGAATGAVAGEPAGATLRLELLGQDRPGIVRDISRALAERQVSITGFETERTSGSFSGEAMFKARALLQLPPGLDPQDLRQALEGLSDEWMVDLGVPAAA